MRRGRRGRTGKAELFDLSRDPGESINLAASDPARVEEYRRLTADWFVRSDVEYTSRIENYRPIGGRKVRPEEYREPGPKIQATGTRKPGFVETAVFRPDERIVVWTTWVTHGRKETSRWRWISPSGSESWTTIDREADWIVTYASYPGALPMEPGRWRVELEGAPQLRNSFLVEREPVRTAIMKNAPRPIPPR